MTCAAHTYDHRDNAGAWAHDDGTPCPTYWCDKPTAPNGALWWCTEHQQHVHVTVPTSDAAAIKRVRATPHPPIPVRITFPTNVRPCPCGRHYVIHGRINRRVCRWLALR